MKTLIFFLTLLSTLNLMAQDGKANTERKTFSRETSVSIRIEASPAIIWNLMTQASDFPRWNSTIVSMEGEIAEGGKIALVSTVDPKRTFKLKVKSITPEQEMIWGSGAAPFFKGTRVYRLTQVSEGVYTFYMSEKIGGLMFPMAAGSIPSFDESFTQFAADLKKEAEAIEAAN
ncbi:MAG: SRPBCC domain-containing protein [Bacteroidota bacterium]